MMGVTIGSNRHSSVTLYSHSNSLYSHLVRFVMSEKNVVYDLAEVDDPKNAALLHETSPYNEVPTLVDRDLVVYNTSIILEYLDERYPHPPLMPVYPISRAETRVLLYRIRQDWYSLAQKVISEKDAVAARDLKVTLLSSSEAVRDSEFFLGDEFSMIDCYLAPLLWRLPMMNIALDGPYAAAWKKYTNMLFSRDTFKASLTHEEINQRALYESGRK
ncbi:MAG: glutathione S-transferase N-terminal domain-containing protein [Succinivibrionaceae bacterium]|nr:glutathione S-transferase N-terminal domain-containing protein [Succinivibrionaceae bacterium]